MFPFTYAAAAAMIPFCLIFLQKMIHSFLKAVRHES
jgi:hypothetical protein